LCLFGKGLEIDLVRLVYWSPGASSFLGNVGAGPVAAASLAARQANAIARLIVPVVDGKWNNTQQCCRPAPGYTMESTLSLSPIVQWLPFWSGPVINLLEVITLSRAHQAQFFCARTP
jgi:hypothetical protein